MKIIVEKAQNEAKADDFAKHELNRQPTYLKGGSLLDYQLDGLKYVVIYILFNFLLLQ